MTNRNMASSPSTFRWRGAFLALCIVLLLAQQTVAQIGQSAIVGTCSDPSGAAVPNGTVVARNVATNQRFESITNASGNYVFPIVPIGTYELSATARGFKTAIRPGILLQVGDRVRVDFALALGVAEQKIEVLGEAPLVQADASGLGQVIENRRIQELPLNGRSAIALAILAPGVRNIAGGVNLGFGRAPATTLANIGINGSGNGFTAFLLDGGVDRVLENGEVAVMPKVDSIVEFKVLTNFLPPEYGLTSGGVVSMVSRSGSNEFHGSAYEFFRNDLLDARKTFDATRSKFRYNQYGGALGGPVWLPKLYGGRDRTFFFFNYEIYRYMSTYNPIGTTPTAAMLRGDFSQLRDASGALITLYDPATTRANPAGAGYIRDVLPGNQIPQARMDRVALNVIPMLPAANRAPNNPYTQSLNYIATQANNVIFPQYNVRIDHSIGTTDHFFARWSMNAEETNHPSAGQAPAWSDPLWYERPGINRFQQGVISDVHTFSPTFLNEVRSAVTRQAFTFTPRTYNQGWPQRIGMPASVPPTLFPVINIAGFPGLGNTNTFGLRYSTGYQLFDMLTKVQSNHTLKFGFEGRLLRRSNYQVTSPSGSYSFATSLTGNPQSQAGTGHGLATFLLGQVASGATLDVFSSLTYVGHTYAFFAGDDWKVTRRLTLNLGLRYDFQSPPVEWRKRESNFNPSVPNPLNSKLQGTLDFAGVDYGDTCVENDRNNFGPRFGFAYDVLGNARTVVRGGYAFLYTPAFNTGFFPSGAGFSLTNSYTSPGNNSNLPAFQLQDGPPYIDQPLGAQMGPSAYLGSAVTWEESRRPTSYTQQWNLGLQRQFRGGWLLDISYAGNRGVKLYSDNWAYNVIDPQYLSLGLALQNQVPNPLAGQVPGSLGNATVTRQQSLLPFPQYTSVTILQPLGGSSTYHALEARVEHRFATGLTLLLSYTDAKLISNAQRNVNNFSGVQTGDQGYQNGKYNRRVERSVDPTDLAQRLVISGVYQLPTGRGQTLAIGNRALRAVAGGWSISGIFTLQGGLPVIVRGANNNLANRPNSTGQSARLSNPSRRRWFDTSQFVNPPMYTYGNVGRTLPDVRGPGLTNFDMALLKNIPIQEKLKLQFRAEAFNLGNLTNLAQPNGTFVAGPNGMNSSSTFGTITAASDARTLQFGLKLIW